MNQPQSNPQPTVLASEDEINLTDLIRNIWCQRGLVIGVTLLALLAVLSFHVAKASFSAPGQVDYAVSLTFLNGKGQYPNGSVFSPRDIVSSRVIEALVSKHSNVSATSLSKAISVEYSNSLLQQSEEKLSGFLVNAKTPEDVRLMTQKELESLRAQTRGTVTVSVDLSVAGLSVKESQALVVELVDIWASQSISRGLMNVDISRPVAAYKPASESNLIDAFENMTKYTDSLESTISQLEKLSGSQSLIVDGKTLEDIKRKLQMLENTDINPLRSFAYSNAAALAEKDPSIRIRLLSRKRLLNLEHDRLTKLIAAYDASLKQLAQADTLDISSRQGVANSQVIGSQMDQSFLNSLLELGNKLSNVEVREALFTKRVQTIEKLLDLEKEIAVLDGSNDALYKNFNATDVLDAALKKIAPELNAVQQQLSEFIDAYRDQSLRSGARLFVADAAPQVRGGGLQVAKKAVLTVALGLVLGLMLGVMVALLRAAMMNSRKA